MKSLTGKIVLLLLITGCSATDFNSEKSQEGSSGTPAPPSGQGSKQHDPARADDARGECEWARAFLGLLASPLAGGGSVDGLTGSGIYSASHVALVRNVTGSLILLGSGASAAIDSVQDLTGSLIACDMSIKSIDGVENYGSIIVVGGDVGSVNNVIGSVLVVDGNITGPVKNSMGSVLALQ